MATPNRQHIAISLIPGDIIALIKENLSVEEAVDLIGGRAEESVIQEIVREAPFLFMIRLIVAKLGASSSE